MKKIKRTLIGLSLLTILLIMTACGSKGSAGANDLNEDSWIEDANLDAEETMDELYEKAKDEGKVVVYSSSSVVTTVAENFMKDYPGIEVQATKLNDVEMTEKIKREQESGVFTADVTFSSGNNGAFRRELLEQGLLHNYNPSFIGESLQEPYNEDPLLQITAEAYAVMYNNEANDVPPVNNWWDLTTPEWEGKVLSNDPLTSANLMSLFLTMIENHEDMAEAYKEKFGEEIKLEGTENAGYEFVKRLMENGLVLMKSGGEAVDGVALSTDSVPPIAIASTVSLRDVINQDYNISIVHDIKPKVSSPILKSFNIANNAPNVNAAKLFIRYMSGGDDGNSAGFDPLNTPGTWALRSNIKQEFDEIVPRYEELNWWDRNDNFIYEHDKDLRDFLLQIQ